MLHSLPTTKNRPKVDGLVNGLRAGGVWLSEYEQQFVGRDVRVAGPATGSQLAAPARMPTMQSC
jgi:hypothetical protein